MTAAMQLCSYAISSQENDAFLPNENDTVYEIFWSKYNTKKNTETPIFNNPFISRAQMRARTDPGMVTVMKALLGLWHSDQVARCVTSLGCKYWLTLFGLTENGIDLMQ